MKHMRYLSVAILIFSLAGCGASDDVGSIEGNINPPLTNEDIGQNQEVEGLTLKIEQDKIVKGEKIAVPLSLNYKGEENLVVKGITIYVKGLDEHLTNASFETSELTADWLNMSKLMVNENQFKVVLINTNSLKDYGIIGNIVIMKNDIKSEDFYNKEYELYAEVADGENIFTSEVVKMKLE